MSALSPAADFMPLNRLVAAYWTEVRFEFARLWRSPAFAFPILVIPLASYLLFGVAIAGEAIRKDPDVAIYLFSGFSVMSVMGSGLFGVGCTLAMERTAGLLQFKRALPAPAGAWVVAKIAVALSFSVLAYVPLLIAALSIGTVDLNALQLAGMSVIYVLGTIPFCALGLLIGTFASGSAAPAYTNLIYLPMIWLSGMFFPLPKFLHGQTLIWPAFHLNQIALRAADAEKYFYIPIQLAIGVLVAVSILCGVLATWRLARRG